MLVFIGYSLVLQPNEAVEKDTTIGEFGVGYGKCRCREGNDGQVPKLLNEADQAANSRLIRSDSAGNDRVFNQLPCRPPREPEYV